MSQTNRQARAKARRKSMALVKKGVPHICSKWSIHGTWKGGGFSASEWQSARKLARREKVTHVDLGARNRNVVDLRDFETKAGASELVRWVHARFKAGTMNVPLTNRIRTVKSTYLTALGAKMRRVIVVAA